MTGATPQHAGARDFKHDLQRALAREMAAPQATKRSALRLAVISLIRSGDLPADGRLPSETAMADMVGLSVGTVQAALGQLRDMGLIQRRRGAGTWLVDGGTISDSIWHFRFFDRRSGKPFRPVDAVIEVLQTNAAGPWSAHLGEASDYTLIRRTLTGDGGVRIGAEMVLNAILFAPGEIPASELKSTNIRMVLEECLGVKATQVQHRVRLTALESRKALLFRLPRVESFLHLEARTTLSDGRPLYHQDIYAPSDELELMF